MSPKRSAAVAPAPDGPTTETAKNDEEAVSTAEEAAKAPDDDGPPPGAAEVGGDEDVSGLEPDPKLAGAPSAAGATETATASGVGPSAVLGKLADDANSRITTVQADASFTNLALPERFKACPNLKKGDGEFVFAELPTTAGSSCSTPTTNGGMLRRGAGRQHRGTPHHRTIPRRTCA